MQLILFLPIGILIYLYFGKIRNFIIKNAAKKAKGLGIDEIVGKRVNKNGEETFQVKKFLKAFKLNSLVLWIKDFLSIFNLRKVIIYIAIISTFFAYGYWKGRLNTPIKINLDYNKEFRMKLDGHYLFKPKFSQDLKIVDKKGNLVKNLKAKDFPMLAKKLKPLGFILEPIFVAGYETKGSSVGGGVSFVKMWKWKLDLFLTSRLGAYLGTSYAITERSGIGVAVGKGLKKSDNRIMIYYKFRF
ncbi:hypothetical protein LCGC14_1962270 [marine sediment metagenome]|uniref:Uncharacterized protein n=1 Tax=marine sediment metagenome TaxID=412755 RepID=A0A0F9G2J2_9ZZZZ